MLMLASTTMASAGPPSLAQVEELPMLRPGCAIAGRIEDGDPVIDTGWLARHRADAPTVGRAFRVDVSDPGPYHVELRSDFFDAYLVLRDDSGAVLAEDDDGLVVTDSLLGFEARPGARLRVEACALHGERGTFELTLKAGSPAALTAEQRLASGIDVLRKRVETRTRALGPAS